MTLRQPPAPEPSLSAGDPPKVAPRDAGLSEHARRNRVAWNADADDYQARHGQQLAGDAKAWGTWGLPESELGVLGDGWAHGLACPPPRAMGCSPRWTASGKLA